MSRRSTRSTREGELLARLGLSGAASSDQVSTAYDELVSFLETAPDDLRHWARSQIAVADEAYALLSDRAAGLESDDAEDEIASAPTRRSPAAPRSGLKAAGRPRLGPVGRALAAAALVVGTLAVGYVVYASDAPAVPRLSGTPAPEGSPDLLDRARVTELMGKIQDDPNDVAALQELGDLFFQAGEYPAAIEWETKVLAILPDDPTAHLAIGAGQYNLGNESAAEEHWRAVLAVDPDNVEAHYDLGFMYFRQEPPDVEQTIAEWQRVIDIAPDSDIAQTVAAHLDTFEEWRASATPGGSPSPASSGLPSPTPSGLPSPSPAPDRTAVP